MHEMLRDGKCTFTPRIQLFRVSLESSLDYVLNWPVARLTFDFPQSRAQMVEDRLTDRVGDRCIKPRNGAERKQLSR